ncbi:MAG: hypothetical protein K0S09_3175 [Sphingobacteriaceae bacterium]|nr:hypothetical protein [Sphingobacteriaceae bacterium]
MVFASSCGSRHSNDLFQSVYDKFADTAKSIYVVNASSDSYSEYRIKPFDLLSIKNIQNPLGLTNSGTPNDIKSAPLFRTDKEGVIQLPVVGAIEVKGLTVSEANKKITKIYAERLLKDPIIEVTVINYKVTILGDVLKQGNYELERENVDLIEMIGESGGLLPSANAGKVKIIRGESRDKSEIIFVNLKDINSLSSDKLILHNNDIVYIPSKGIYNTNESIKNYTNLFQPAILLLNAAILVYTLSR